MTPEYFERWSWLYEHEMLKQGQSPEKIAQAIRQIYDLWIGDEQ